MYDNIQCIANFARQTSTLIPNILQCVQRTHNGPPQKPAVIPLSSPEEVNCFETIDDESYSNVVRENEIMLLFTFI